MPNDMTGRLVLITGGTAGIGKQSALQLGRLGAHVVIVGRDPQKCERVTKELQGASGNERVEHLVADLSSMEAVRGLAAAFKQRHGKLNVLLNNAGGVNRTREVTADGYERTFATNHLAPFLLTRLLLEELAKGAPARVVSVSSLAHRGQSLDFDDLMAERAYSAWRQYGRSKLANVMFTAELARGLQGRAITANCLHPGFVASDFLWKGPFWHVIKPVSYLFAMDEQRGARTSVYLASSPEVEGVSGKYFSACREQTPSRQSQDADAVRQLWEVSEQLTGLKRKTMAA
jgi:NAD(P)-dependent dehydrogenase (short-subunit alcohol dehydrogenase family)